VKVCGSTIRARASKVAAGSIVAVPFTNGVTSSLQVYVPVDGALISVR